MDADVIVVGAGLAGLRCARVLQDAGRQVVVLEAATHVGGRVTQRAASTGSSSTAASRSSTPPIPPSAAGWTWTRSRWGPSTPACWPARTPGSRVLADPRRTPRLGVGHPAQRLLDAGDVWGLGRWLAPSLARPQAAAAGPDTTLARAVGRPPPSTATCAGCSTASSPAWSWTPTAPRRRSSPGCCCAPSPSAGPGSPTAACGGSPSSSRRDWPTSARPCPSTRCAPRSPGWQAWTPPTAR